MNSDSDYARGDFGERALVAAFADRQNAHDAAKRLREDGFHKIWIDVTRDDATVTSGDDSVGAKIGRFFRGEADGGSMVDTLMQHGIPAADAQRLERRIAPGDVLLTVDGSNHPERAARIIEDRDGDVLSGESFVFTSVEWMATDDMLGSQMLGYEDPDKYARGQRIDDTGVSRLRNERLQSGMVPTVREDVFVMSFDDEDDSERSEDSGRRSAGGAVGTQHQDDRIP